MALLDGLAERLRAIIAGEHPPVSPWIPAGTLDLSPVHLPTQNARFPASTRSAVKDRRCTVAWERLTFDPVGSENTSQGPWVRGATATITVQYEVVHPAAPTPTTIALSVGALERATRWALDDAALLQWAVMRPGAFDGFAIGVAVVGEATAARIDQHRVAGVTRVRFLLSQPATTSPGVAS
jgi:hypothetical protein